MEMRLYDDSDNQNFQDSFVNYFVGDLNAPLPEQMIRDEIVPKYTDLSTRGIAPILLAIHDQQIVGFINFQIDSDKSNWNERPGWGMIRELHVDTQWRNQGIGTALVQVAVEAMRQSGAAEAYLTTEENVLDFWEHLGWRRTDAIAPNGGTIMEKTLTSP